MIDERATPRRSGTPLPASLGAFERLVLASIDGRTAMRALADVTGLDPAQIDRIVARLQELALIEVPKVDGAPKATELDIDAALQKKITDFDARIDDLDHYAILGVTRDADRKAIKSAYYALASTYHTDRYFGKRLGDFKAKMERIFSKVTQAHDVLANKERRAEYDVYMQERDRTRAFETLLAAVDDEAASIDAFLDAQRPAPTTSTTPTTSTNGSERGSLELWRDVRLESTNARTAGAKPGETPKLETWEDPSSSKSRVAAGVVPAHAVAAAPAAAPPPTAKPSAPPPPPSAPPPPMEGYDDTQRRLALARRLGASRMTTGRREPSAPGAPVRRVPTADEARMATESLKQRYFDAREAGRLAQAARLVAAAKEALAKDDVVVAANHYRLAVRYTDDPEVQRKGAEVQRRAKELMAEAYIKQAKYEEGAGKWREAATSWEKACEGRADDPEPFARAAVAHHRVGRDLHRAARYGEAAVQKNPSNAAFRVTLGAVYLDAGLHLRAKSELEQALKLEPNNARAKELMVQVKKRVVHTL